MFERRVRTMVLNNCDDKEPEKTGKEELKSRRTPRLFPRGGGQKNTPGVFLPPGKKKKGKKKATHPAHNKKRRETICGGGGDEGAPPPPPGPPTPLPAS